MSRKSKLLSRSDDADITDDDSCLMTEQSSVSNLSAEDKSAIESQDDLQQFTDIETQQEMLEYTEMQIEEPPSFFDSQYTIPHSIAKLRIKHPPALLNAEEEDKDDIDSEDEFFQKKNQSKGARAFDINRSATCSDEAGPNSRSQRDHKPRKPRKLRKPRQPRDRDEKNPLFQWIGKRDEPVKLPTLMKGTLKHDSSYQQPFNENGDVKFVADSSASIPGTCTGEIRKKGIKHITVALDEEKETLPIPEKKKYHELQIAGVNVKFPVKPYPSQIAVMNKLIQGCKKQEHCLLESPTGSGKTLALLCGVLAWQDHMKDEVRQQNTEAALRSRELFEREYKAETAATTNNPPSTESKTDEQPSSAMNCRNADEFSNSEVLQPSKKVCRSTSPNPTYLVEDKCAGSTLADEENLEILLGDGIPKKIPKIYYGSRTHKQIEQIIRELKKTVYAYKKMTILSSREFTCLHDTDENKTDLCTRLLDPTKDGECKYYNENNRSKINSNAALRNYGIHGPWDIEDLVKIGREHGACPYFAARDLMMEAEIIFCPYNYLIDRNIRDSMQLQLNGQVIILDEAHNVEEMSREVGSLTFREDRIKEVIEESQSLCIIRNFDFETYNTIKLYLNSLLKFIKMNPLTVTDSFNDTSSSNFWNGVELWQLFEINSLGKQFAKNFERAAAAAIMDYNTAKEETTRNRDFQPTQVICTTAKRFLEDLVLALEIMAFEKLSNDYRACIIESNVREYVRPSANNRGTQNSGKCLRTLQMLCMNPAVVFSQLSNAARTIILASGTLSPIHSFQSELGTVFPHKLDANHVVPKENVYIRGIACGPTGVQLKANYANVNSWNFQDELGRLVVHVCRVIPHGVLCFFSSYSVMQKQIDRWKESSIWDQLEKMKHVLQEPRGSSNLEPVMQQFREIIKETSPRPKNGITGALLFAVFRGKVAEGIDFSDNEARCVMAVGIPYAVRKDPSVDMKFTYNNLNQPKGLLKGGEWYAVQAFRALNQALGRCVRHRNDWGAVLLVDQRFLERSNYNYLPKWVKTMWRNSVNFNLTEELREFVTIQLEREQREMEVLDSADPETSNT